jgi:hypothetical protein
MPERINPRHGWIDLQQFGRQVSHNSPQKKPLKKIPERVNPFHGWINLQNSADEIAQPEKKTKKNNKYLSAKPSSRMD